MTHAEAIDLISPGIPNDTAGKVWVELGCGKGVFTNALAELLGNGSRVWAVDRRSELGVSNSSSAAEIMFHQSDFVKEDLPVQPIDGVLMANAIHYVENKSEFILKLKRDLRKGGTILIVDYDTTRSNQWVPYPLNYSEAIKLFSSLGFTSIRKIGERRSIYQSSGMYACAVVSP